MFTRKPSNGSPIQVRADERVNVATRAYFKAMSEAGFKVCCVGMFQPGDMENDSEVGFGVIWAPGLAGDAHDGDKMAKEIVSEMTKTIITAAKRMADVEVSADADFGKPNEEQIMEPLAKAS